jgi:hypothetical protein
MVRDNPVTPIGPKWINLAINIVLYQASSEEWIRPLVPTFCALSGAEEIVAAEEIKIIFHRLAPLLPLRWRCWRAPRWLALVILPRILGNRADIASLVQHTIIPTYSDHLGPFCCCRYRYCAEDSA